MVTQTDVANTNDYEMVRMKVMWWAFSKQRGPVEKIKVVITELA